MAKSNSISRWSIKRNRRPAKRTCRLLRRRTSLETLEKRQLLMADFTLELLHVADQEAGAAAIQDAPRLSAVLNGLRSDDVGGDGLADNTLTLSSGDAFIPGLFYDASEPVFGSGGIADIQIQNELGIQAIALGNHEFDFGTGELAGLIDGSAPGTILGSDFGGADFPYVSTNLDFSTDPNLAPLETTGGQPPQANTVTSSVVIDVNGEQVGVIGATTPTLDIISSPGDVGISPDDFDVSPTAAQLDALAAEIQLGVDDLLTANPSVDKVILLAHMQQIDIELELAERLSNVDIIVAGGSNTRLFDSNDRIRAGDSDQGDYPQFVTDADGAPTAVVNTDGSYKYVGRLVLDFDASGNIDPGSYDPIVSGAYATDQQGVDDLLNLGLDATTDPEIQQIIDQIEDQIIETESNVFGISDVFLNGNRSGTDDPTDPDGVRTQETNLGNLTADANLAAAQDADPTVLVSIKNGGGIRSSIGQTIVPAGGSEPVRSPNEAVFDSEGNLIKPEGGISQNDIQTTLAFNNGLTLLTLTKTELVDVLEHGVGAIPMVSGRFPQISGLKFSYDPSRAEGSRIESAAIFDASGNLIVPLVRDGAIVGDPTETIRIVTLGFLADGGDGYPFPMGAEADRVDLAQEGVMTGDATFEDDGTEQDALAEYLDDNFASEATAFSQADTGRLRDQRIQNLNFRADTIYPTFGTVRVTNGDDFGEGSFRNAVQVASDNPGVERIVFSRGVSHVLLESSVEYFGTQDLQIDGNDVVITPAPGADDFDLFVSSEGADLQLKELTFQDSGLDGIFIPVPGDATGIVNVLLRDVALVGNGLYGLHIDDQTENSPAGIDLTMFRTEVIGNGFKPGFDDFDGVRVDEGGEGDATVSIRWSTVVENAADGVEIDEKGDGNVVLDAFFSTFSDNGSQPQLPEDLEDGLDIDEAGDGGIRAKLFKVQANNNFDEGIDFDEEGNGDLEATLRFVEANGNGDEGIKFSEDADAEPPEEGVAPSNLNASGDIRARLFAVNASNNGDDGIEFEEFGPGDLDASLSFVKAVNNDDDGFQASEGSGDYPAGVADSQNEGDLKVRVKFSSFRDNSDAGINVEQIGPGDGELRLQFVDFDDNGDGPIDASGVSVRGRHWMS